MQDALSPDSQAPADNLAAVIVGDAIREQIQTYRDWGFSPQDLRLIFTYKARMHQLRQQLDDALQKLAVVMYTRYEDPELRLKAAREAMAECRRVQQEDERLQQELIQKLGAENDPVKMAGLVLLGVASGGRRTLCQVKVGVAGGAQAIGSRVATPGLRQSFNGGQGNRERWLRRWRGSSVSGAQPGNE
ncbi:MAG: hypothetical protein H5T86_15595 [Armatimonadetes bacterium]|nr:hypothetical protein [Armatimonadota bacterium]